MDIESTFTLAESASVSPSEEAAVKRILREFNHTANAELWAKFDQPQYSPQPLCIVAHDQDREVAGGLFASMSMSWLKVEIMAVREDSRRCGLGSSMLKAAEQAAKQRHCKYAFLDTMDYQAPDFYRENDYVVAGKIDDWDSHGHTKYFFTKTL